MVGIVEISTILVYGYCIVIGVELITWSYKKYKNINTNIYGELHTN